MTYSMTAFARCDADTEWGSLAWEVRSVNHRYLEVNSRLPDELRSLEPKIRKLVNERLARGKVDCNLRFQSKDLTNSEFELNEALVESIVNIAGKVRQATPDVSPLRTLDLLSQSLDEFLETRQREGERMRNIIEQRLDAAVTIVSDLRETLPDVRQNFRQRLEERLAELKQELDPARLEQEIVLFAQKTDVEEELDRLQTHVDEARRVLGGTGQIGRRQPNQPISVLLTGPSSSKCSLSKCANRYKTLSNDGGLRRTPTVS